MLLGVCLMLGALGLLAYNRWDDIRAGQDAEDTLNALKEAMEASENGDGTADKTDEDETDETDETDTESENVHGSEMDTIEIDGYEYIGTLSIPDISLELPVMAEWSYKGLKKAPGLYSGSVWTDDMVICGHNYQRHFGNLKYLEEGAAVVFTDVSGNVFNYRVAEVGILKPTAVDEMLDRETEDWDLTLFTCTVGGRTRVTVRCMRTDESES